jgi:hypothetical protein
MYAFAGVTALVFAGILKEEGGSLLPGIVLALTGVSLIAKGFSRPKPAPEATGPKTGWQPPSRGVATPGQPPEEELAMAEPIEDGDEADKPKPIAGKFGGKKLSGGKFTQAATPATGGQMTLTSAKYLNGGKQDFRKGTTKHTGNEGGSLDV